MDLKSFKAGIEYLAKSTNQREKEPTPFLVQVGKDGRLSLVCGNRLETYAWRTGVTVDSPPLKEGVSSKLLVQTTKVLKAKDITVELSVSDTALAITTSIGGVVRLPFIDPPELFSPRLGGANGAVDFKDGRLAQLVRYFEATGEGQLSRGVRFIATTDGMDIVSTEDHKMFATVIPSVQANATEEWGSAVSFWKPLRAATSNAAVFFHESGLRVQAGEFEAFTGRSRSWAKVVNLRNTYYPLGVKPDVYTVLDRKVLLGSIKGVTPNDKTGMVEMFRSAEGNVGVDSGQQHIGLPAKMGKGWGRVGFSAELMTDILTAMDGKQVIVAWLNSRENPPLAIRDLGNQGDWFLLAQRVKV